MQLNKFAELVTAYLQRALVFFLFFCFMATIFLFLYRSQVTPQDLTSCSAYELRKLKTGMVWFCSLLTTSSCSSTGNGYSWWSYF